MSAGTWLERIYDRTIIIYYNNIMKSLDYSFYTVISPKRDHYKAVKRIFLSKFTNKDCVVIKEMGKHKDHPHLNILWIKDARFTKLDTLTKFLGRLYKPTPYWSKNLIDSQHTYYLDGLFNYTSKEMDYKIVYSDGKIEAIIEKLNARQGPSSKFKKRFQLHVTNDQIIDYICNLVFKDSDYGLHYIINKTFSEMTKEGYYINPQQSKNLPYFCMQVNEIVPGSIEVPQKFREKYFGLNIF